MSLALRIRLLVLALCLGLGLAVFAAFGFLANRQVNFAVRDNVQSEGSTLATMIRGRGELQSSLTQFIATSPRTRDLALTDAATVTDVVKSLRADVGVDALTIVDRDGKLLGEDGFPQESGGEIAHDPALQAALKGAGWSGIVNRDGVLQLAAAQPLKVGEFIQGAVATYFHLDEALAKQLTTGQGLELGFAANGRLLSSSNKIDNLSVPLLQKPFEVKVGGLDAIAQAEPLPGTTADQGLDFVVYRPTRQILKPYQQFAAAFAIFLILAFGIALVTGSAFGGNIARTLDGLVNSAKALQQGKWPEKLVVKRNDEIGLLQTVFNEMSDSLKSSTERLMAMIDLDPLTELDNHRRFKERLAYEAARAAAEDQPIALLLMDIDYFSKYNEDHGHLAGDGVLKTLANTLKSKAPELAVISRFGGEEFAVLLPGARNEDAERLFAEVSKRIRVEFGLTLSAGCSELNDAKGKTEGLVVACELASAQAKQMGRDRICRFDSAQSEDGEDPIEIYKYLQDGTYATIRALAAAVDAKDAYTHGHSDRVAAYSTDLAAYMGADPAEVDMIKRSGTLHDVGKIGVPDAILKKPSRLEPDEQRIMESHPVLGEVIVAKAPQLAPLLPGVRHHHERFDGKGYPDGLAGYDIPRMARFIAIADTYDAMTSDRPYRKGLDVEIALSEIEKGAGTQFDPEMAVAFVAMMRSRILQNAA